MSAAADKLRAWAKGLEAAKKGPQAAALVALAKVVEDEIATAGQSVAADAAEGTERVCLEPIAAELTQIRTALMPEFGGKAVEAETFDCINAIKRLSARIMDEGRVRSEMADEVAAAKKLVQRMAAKLSEIKTAGHAEAPIAIEATADGVAKALEAFHAQFDYAMTGVRQMGEETRALKTQLADARGALDVLHRALHGNLTEQTAVAPS